MNNNPSQNDHNDQIFTESNNLQPTADIIQPEQGYFPNIVASNSGFSMNDDNICPTSQTNNNYSVHQHAFNENITISRSYPPIDLQQSTANAIQPDVINVDFSLMNDNSISPTPHTNNKHFNQQHTSNVQSYPPPITSSYAQQYGHPSSSQPIENTSTFNTTTINPSQPEIFSFDIPGFKIIIVPTFPQQDNTYSNYSSLGITDNQFTQFRQ
ncbi:hypothetical protein RhiirA5_415737 [Rhizophagus irregularis]|uniref:Uncharacterized protein n=3 Tax=Rhizophagus irregularis TaxID=588596 RepID=U9US14_RHIID|nr:hypothetical protein GLOIN_2v1822231 [Rhizophagus irregularis DAOM 181602=DAOM 197198]EXX52456.1 hypothetical protein RirG_252930 [Rhizophagus irregularis DAOM 197198w]PKC09387.1 hypothetical protein RhiirA5_415737 [Rhizophagus irregularis]PKY12660.1 hypothetical protein RhiirB3_510307 [Rhizophagus irregularis]POG75877.1 hypothetical protein GLOIN_2v1822231 [Rhizophagus irregularis DAOM 181602=DAOM 197198]UZO20979.1 hypothetical protein OCT59_013388 [Rhizophagus irregularis]|eukprot:XP_025182743.1 hypothetical protein GLOIN_2v1822231 [Rhizophagus irregularis DAOM 181602=DAOM 197198]